LKRSVKTTLCVLLAAGLAGCQTLGLALLNVTSPRVRVESGLEFAPGAFERGDRADYRFVGAGLAAQGFVTVVPDYRVHPEAGLPEFMQDAARAVAKAQAESARWGADPCRIVLAGHSAGAYIAALLALEPRYLREAGVDPQCVRGWVGLSGPYDIEPDTAVLNAIFTARATPDDFKPVRRVSRSSPPALLVHGEADRTVWPMHSERMAAALRAQGIAVDLQTVPDRRHVDTVLALSRPGHFRIPELQARIGAFVRDRTAR
jgi:acetyl esterase/lipase